MNTLEQIKKEKQAISKSKQSLALAKLKKRREDTRCKIELGGLVIKAGMVHFNKSIILGCLGFTTKLIEKQPEYKKFFEEIGNELFLK
ncbi:conjugal transfer protein TraD [Legionella pneumophila]|uniref:conjugal transfer protein TraD n=1 Tax=Legionella pneumophila TaxID=446 RepID=UPI001012F144|nr:conjugal transfer protein TraD [Legionella pneumophila]RYB30293.1 conjugal transfer protein TraD [Legionella pneumophila]RYB40761.1 conjugal transfer protein TraD [Legionella pneumophila]RYB46774.1 conjugal transfer protein TraD [Legionella pneumophila]RYB59547.1 conjugal transfer protein TraD [Legionella pneumophila]RYB59980.1 conjugal transfer protein TraD [Legionella pneumophila]